MVEISFGSYFGRGSLQKNNIQIIDGLGKRLEVAVSSQGIGLDKDNKTPPILTLVIPVYNEKDNILSLLENIKNSIKIPISLSIVYDEDSDNTLPVVREVMDNYNCPRFTC